MSEYEPDECSFESTSEKSCKKLIPHCSPEYLRKLTPEGAELNEKLVGKCVENNFPMREKRLKNDLLNSDDENSTKKIENLENAPPDIISINPAIPFEVAPIASLRVNAFTPGTVM